jgi:hypothetical protein
LYSGALFRDISIAAMGERGYRLYGAATFFDFTQETSHRKGERMARFRLKQGVTLIQVGAKVRALYGMSDTEFRQMTQPNANQFFSDVFELAKDVDITVVKDSAKSRHIIVPWYAQGGPPPAADEAAGLVAILGCGD